MPTGHRWEVSGPDRSTIEQAYVLAESALSAADHALRTARAAEAAAVEAAALAAVAHGAAKTAQVNAKAALSRLEHQDPSRGVGS